MKKELGKIIGTFTISEGLGRVLLLDKDCSSEINIGEMIEVQLPNTTVLTFRILDGILEQGSKHNIPLEKISAIRIEDIGFEDEEHTVGGTVLKL